MPKSAVYFELEGLVNLTSEVSIFRNLGPTRIEALEYDTDRIIFECLEKSCNSGQLVKVDGFICYPKKRIKFSCVGKIVQASALDQGSLRVTIHLLQYNKQIWMNFLQEMNSRQDGVDSLFDSLKEDE